MKYWATLFLICLSPFTSLFGQPKGTTTAKTDDRPQAVAYYFPNWHRQAGTTNDSFGEWPSLARATPRFAGHQQPKHPLWGVEDEADPGVMAKKIAAAADHGLSAFLFCWYYHAEGSYLADALDRGYLQAT